MVFMIHSFCCYSSFILNICPISELCTTVTLSSSSLEFLQIMIIVLQLKNHHHHQQQTMQFSRVLYPEHKKKINKQLIKRQGKILIPYTYLKQLFEMQSLICLVSLFSHIARFYFLVVGKQNKKKSSLAAHKGFKILLSSNQRQASF